MQSLYSLPVLDDLFRKSKYKEALSIANEAIEILAPHLIERFPATLDLEPDHALILSKIYLIQRDYESCVRYALQAKNLLPTLDQFYHESIMYRMMDFLLEHPASPMAKELRAFILDYIKEDGTNASYLGFLAEIGEFALLKEKIGELSKAESECTDILDTLLQEYHDELYDVFLTIGDENQHLLNYKIDALVFEDKTEDLTALLSGLPWEKMYAACFYIEDTYRLPLHLPNENANFILSGDWKQEIMSNFMLRNSKTSFKFLESMSKARAPFISLCNCIMNAGTTNDTLYRNNKGLLSGRSWTRFMDYAPLGMIHHGNSNAFEILKEMLPSLESSNGEPAALMALGSMNVRSCDKETTDFLLNWLESTSDEIIFGACMGLGLNLLQSGDKAVYERLKTLLSLDSTIAQESALYAIGMIYASTESEEVLDFLHSIATKADFPRVKRVCGIAISLVCIATSRDDGCGSGCAGGDNDNDSGYGSVDDGGADDDGADNKSNKNNKNKNSNSSRDENSENSYETMNIKNALKSSDATERASALLTLGTSFVATSNLKIIERILPLVNDGDDDVKRNAVIAIALIGYEDPCITTSCLIPFAQNHNSHVRAAVALVLGFFNAGMGDNDICSLLEAMLYDSEDLVRQSACMGMGFALMQMNPTLVPAYKRILDKINRILVSKSEALCVKIGASVGRAIAEAGGRSAVFSLDNFSKSLEVKRVVGAVLFLQSWYWYPLMGCLSLCLLPTPIFFFDESLNETSDVFNNEPSFYDHLVKIPEVRRSRKFKHNRETDIKDTITEAPKGLSSGSRLTKLEKIMQGVECGVIFKK